VGCFTPLKKSYRKQVRDLIQNSINYITKIKFLPVFRAVFNTSITLSNIREAFRDTGLVPFNPEAVISTLDVRLKTLTPPLEVLPWESKTLSNIIELVA
jgi:hypothetical protein